MTTNTDLAGLEHTLALVPPDHEWLVRSDGPNGYFVNLQDSTFVATMGQNGYCYKARAATPELAMREALTMLRFGRPSNV